MASSRHGRAGAIPANLADDLSLEVVLGFLTAVLALPTRPAAPAASPRLLDPRMMHSTNYIGAFIAVADDCPVDAAVVPPAAPNPTVARMQYDLIAAHPYGLTSDEVIFAVHAARTGIAPEDLETSRTGYFAKGRACLRASPLGKRYGWGIHHDEEGRVALHARESAEYARLSRDGTLRQLSAMRSAR